MKFSNSDFHMMSRSIVVVCISILISGVVLYTSSVYAISTKDHRRTAQTELNSARNKLAMARQDQVNLADYSKEYDTLESNKIIGDDHRLDWMEGLAKLRQQNLVIDFSYNIAPLKKYVLQPTMDTGNFDIDYSEMKLRFELLHEGQLLNFFDALRRQIKGYYKLEGCKLERATAVVDTGPSTVTNIKAECNGGWITLKNRNSPS